MRKPTYRKPLSLFLSLLFVLATFPPITTHAQDTASVTQSEIPQQVKTQTLEGIQSIENEEQLTTTDTTVPDVADGIYRIVCKSNSLPIGTDGNIASGLSITTRAWATVFPHQLYQFFKITHLGNHLYSVRPCNKLNFAMCYSYGNVANISIGITDSLTAVPSTGLWEIRNTANGYSFKLNGSNSSALTVANGSTPGLDVYPATYSSGSSQCHFTLTKITTAPAALLLYNANSGDLLTSSYGTGKPTKSVAIGETKPLSQIGLSLAVCDPNTNSQVVVWETSNAAIADVDMTSGAVTAKSIGEVTITAYKAINGTLYSVSYNLVVTIPNGTYFIKSKSSGKYTDIYNQTMSNGTVIHQWDYHGGNTQRWTFTNLGDGTFTIHSANSTTRYYLGVSGDSTANNQAVVLRTGTVTNGMKWKVVPTSSGAYKLVPLTGEANNRVLALETGILGIANSNGNVLQQRDYVNDTNYNDEWIICKYDTSILLAIDDADGSARHTYFTDTASHLQTEKNGIVSVVSTARYSSCSVANMIDYLQNNNIFIVHTHGIPRGFKIGDGSYITIPNLNNVDLSNLDFALLLTCNTGVGYSSTNITNNTPVNIIEKMVICGAKTVIGFNAVTYVADCNKFAPDITEQLIKEGLTVEDAINRISYSSYINNMSSIAVIAGDADNRLR